MAELVLSNIEKSYKVEKVLDNMNISMKNGVHGLVGANGAGKTTLMKIICDLLKYDGKVSYNSTNVKQTEEKYRKHEHNQKVSKCHRQIQIRWNHISNLLRTYNLCGSISGAGAIFVYIL